MEGDIHYALKCGLLRYCVERGFCAFAPEVSLPALMFVPDVVAVTGNDLARSRIYIFEVKASRSDFRAFMRKKEHYYSGAGVAKAAAHFLYFVAPPGMLKKEELGTWGLIEPKQSLFKLPEMCGLAVTHKAKRHDELRRPRQEWMFQVLTRIAYSLSYRRFREWVDEDGISPPDENRVGGSSVEPCDGLREQLPVLLCPKVR